MNTNTKPKRPIIHHLFILLCLAVVSSGCTAIYGVANFTSESTLLEKPSYRDSVAQKNYLTGSYHYSRNNSDEEEGITSSEGHENIQMAVIQYHTAVSKEFFSYGCGVFVHGGNYRAITFEKGPLGGNKAFIGGGGTGEITFNVPFKHVDWRVIGLKMTYLYEGGQYAQFRADAQSASEESAFEFSSINLNPSDHSFNTGLTSEIVIKAKKFDLGLSMVIGTGNHILTLGNKIYFSKDTFSVYLSRNYSIIGDYYSTGFAYKW